VDMQQAVLKRRAFDEDVVGKLEPALESAGGNALMQIFGLGLTLSRDLLAANGERLFLHFDGQVLLGEAGNG
ncbi:hypothetical protein H3289_28235, partial [Escherichia coli]|uniref:hypothetical protein n=1 Tax=Escherichia coli TaxID=562 RepID=UPI0015F3A7A3|nr:hypothetical protein [Escherichia coli]